MYDADAVVVTITLVAVVRVFPMVMAQLFVFRVAERVTSVTKEDVAVPVTKTDVAV